MKHGPPLPSILSLTPSNLNQINIVRVGWTDHTMPTAIAFTFLIHVAQGLLKRTHLVGMKGNPW